MRSQSVNTKAVLTVLLLANFIVTLDIAVVNVAVPSIGAQLHAEIADLQWVVTLYALMLGGLLLFGGRAADLFGRRRVLMWGISLFTLASVAAGMAPSIEALLVARAMQGTGAALIVPAALAILVNTFQEGTERTKALGAFGGVGAMAATFGVVVGGALTSGPGWEWVFFINIPIGIAMLVIAWRAIPANRPVRGEKTDLLGAVLVTSGLLAVVLAISNGPDYGWTSGQTLGSFALGFALLVGFVVTESRVSAPLVPLRIFRRRTLTGASVVAALTFAALFGSFFQVSVFLQGALGFSALRTGSANLAIGLMAALVAIVFAPKVVSRFGAGVGLSMGSVATAGSLVLLAQVGADATYWANIFPAFLLMGVGAGFAGMAIEVAAFIGVQESESGLTGGIVETAREVGGALGVAIMASVGFAVAALAPSGIGDDPIVSLVDGFQRGMYVGAGFAIAAAIASALIVVPAERAAARSTADVQREPALI